MLRSLLSAILGTLLVVCLACPVYGQTLSYTVSSGTDDGVNKPTIGQAHYWTTNWTVLMGKGNEESKDYWANSNFLFKNVAIAQGASIQTAYLKLTAYSAGSAATSWIYAEDTGSASAYTYCSDFQGAARTTEKVEWTVTEWSSKTVYSSPSIHKVIQEIVDREDWSSGNNIMILLEDPDYYDPAFYPNKDQCEYGETGTSENLNYISAYDCLNPGCPGGPGSEAAELEITLGTPAHDYSCTVPQTSSTTAQSFVDYARYSLEEPVPLYWSDAELLNWVNYGVVDIYARAQPVICQETIPLYTGTTEYSLEQNYIGVIDVRYVDSNSTEKGLIKSIPSALGQVVDDSEPTYYYLSGSKIGIFPRTDTDDETATVYYLHRPSAVALSEAVSIPEMYDRALTLYVLHRAWYKLGQYSKADQYIKEYYEELDRFRFDYHQTPKMPKESVQP